MDKHQQKEKYKVEDGFEKQKIKGLNKIKNKSERQQNKMDIRTMLNKY